MKSATFATVLAIAITAVSAQLDITAIPTCATTCALTSISNTECPATDFECICKDSTFLSKLAPCISTACGEEDQKKMIDMATGLCSTYGVDIPADVISSANGTTNGTTNGTITTRPGSPTTSTDPGASSTAGAARMVGSGFVAAAMGAAMLVL